VTRSRPFAQLVLRTGSVRGIVVCRRCCSRYCVPLLLVLFSAAAQAQGQNIRGVVLREATSEAVAGAEVILLDAAGKRVGSAVTTSDGFFTLQSPPGSYSFRVIRVGLTPATTPEFTLPADSTRIEVTLVLSAEPVAVLLPEIAVEAEAIPRGKLRGFHLRQLDGFGHFVTRDEIESYQPRLFTDILRRVPGVYLVPGGFGRGNIILSMRGTGLVGSCAPLIFLDGVLMRTEQSPDTYLNPDEVAGVEVYNGPATTPERFKTIDSPCGVVVVWTR